MFFGTPHGGGSTSLVALAAVAANIATGLGFSQKTDIISTLKKGSIFSDILKESFRHQLLDYQIVSFWEKLDNVSLLHGPVFCFMH